LVFWEDRRIAYGWYNQEGHLIKGFAWVLKDDGTYDKVAVKYIEKYEYTFISNEKEYILDKEIK
jgi:hypothetical protein